MNNRKCWRAIFMDNIRRLLTALWDHEPATRTASPPEVSESKGPGGTSRLRPWFTVGLAASILMLLAAEELTTRHKVAAQGLVRAAQQTDTNLFRIISVSNRQDIVTITYESLSNFYYSVYRSTNLTDDFNLPIGAIALGQDGFGEFTDSSNRNTAGFYRVLRFPADLVVPSLSIVGGNYQTGFAGAFLPLPLAVRATWTNNIPFLNLPLTYSAGPEGGRLADLTNAPPLATSLTLPTDASGQSAAFHLLPSPALPINLITVTARSGTNLVSITFTNLAYLLPTITTQPVNLTVIVGSTAMFNVEAAGTPPLSFQWFFNQTNGLSNATNARLTITNVQISDNGLYSVMVSNAAGSVWSSDASLEIDTDGDGLSDSWERRYFGDLNQREIDDFDEDGITNWQEFQGGTDPSDVYNGVFPAISIVGGDNQSAPTSIFLSEGLRVLVARNGVGISNAPVTYSIVAGSGGLTKTFNGTPVYSTLTVNTDVVGQGGFFFKPTSTPGTTNRISATISSGPISSNIIFSAYTITPPAPILGKVFAGYSHSFAVEPDGTLWVWGFNNKGQLGDGTQVPQLTPMRLDSIRNVSSMGGGTYASVALLKDSTALSWGDNTYRQLGSGSSLPRPLPGSVVGLPPIKTITAGYNHFLAIGVDGSLWSWGYNDQGQLGTGAGPDRSTPQQVGGLSNVVSAAAGIWHGVAVKSDGTVWSWGNNIYGQLGHPNSTIPVQVPGISSVVAVEAGDHHTVALKADGNVWAWGYNGLGVLGDGTGVNSEIPVQAIGLTDIVAISAKGYNGLALKRDGSLWAWGHNSYGQLGVGATVYNNIPLRVLGINNVTSFATGTYHALAVTQDGAFWSWGGGWEGALGTGAVTDRKVPGLVNLKFVMDSDEDGMLDSYEAKYGLNPYLDDRLADPDRDGVNNYNEFLIGRNPTINGAIPDTTGVIKLKVFTPLE